MCKVRNVSLIKSYLYCSCCAHICVTLYKHNSVLHFYYCRYQKKMKLGLVSAKFESVLYLWVDFFNEISTKVL